MLIDDFNKRFHELKAMEFPSWLTQPLSIDLSPESEQRQQKLCELQQVEVLKTHFKIKGTTMWLSEECKKIPSLEYLGKTKTDQFSVTCLVECGISIAVDLLRAKQNQLEITKRGDLRLKLTNVEPQIKQICNQDQVQRSNLAMWLSIAMNLSKLCAL